MQVPCLAQVSQTLNHSCFVPAHAIMQGRTISFPSDEMTCSLNSLRWGYIGGYIVESHRGYQGGYWEFRLYSSNEFSQHAVLLRTLPSVFCFSPLK